MPVKMAQTQPCVNTCVFYMLRFRRAHTHTRHRCPSAHSHASCALPVRPASPACTRSTSARHIPHRPSPQAKYLLLLRYGARRRDRISGFEPSFSLVLLHSTAPVWAGLLPTGAVFGPPSPCYLAYSVPSRYSIQNGGTYHWPTVRLRDDS